MLEYRHAALQLVRHWLLCEGRHSIHSPFLFRFYNEVLSPPARDLLPDVERLRSALGSDERILSEGDHGSGRRNSRSKSVRSVVRNEVAGSSLASCYCSIIRFLNARNILEVGTSLGLTTLYLSAQPETQVITLEANEEIARMAADNFRFLRRDNIRLITGNADHTLSSVLDGFIPEVAIVDANHRLDPTVRYFKQLKENMSEKGVIVIDDIHYSKEMSMAWEAMISDPAVSMTLDCYRFGVIFLDPALPVGVRRMEVPLKKFYG